MTNTAIVIGAGIGGITTAIHLARQGVAVTLVEKNAGPGGRCSQFEHEGHTFDTGPTLLVMPLLYEQEFAALGSDLHKELDLQRIDPTYHLVFDDGQQLHLSSDLESMYAQLETLEPGSFTGFLRYMEEGAQHYNLAMEHLVGKDFRKPLDFFNPAKLAVLFKLKPLLRHYQHMGKYFKAPLLKAAFTFQDVYMGLSPFEAPATFSMMPYTELAHGVWYPKGGMYSIIKALMKIAIKANVSFRFNASVAQILVEDNQAHGVVLDTGDFLAADIVVANADLPYVYDALLPPEPYTDRLLKRKFSCSVISFFWGMDRTYHVLPPHTLFLANSYRENFEGITNGSGLCKNPSLYIHAPARVDASTAPPDTDTIIAIVPVGHIHDETTAEWCAIREQARKAVFERLKLLDIHDFEDHIKFEVNYTPLSWRKRYNLLKGATHGLSHTLMQLGYFRPHNRHARYHNLYFVGASTHPGTGAPTALVCGRLVAERIAEEQLMVAAQQPSQHLWPDK